MTFHLGSMALGQDHQPTARLSQGMTQCPRLHHHHDLDERIGGLYGTEVNRNRD
jgi:hypothetical protein